MSSKLSTWLKKEIKLPLWPPQNRPTPPWLRVVNKVIVWGVSLLLVWFVGWRILLYREIEQRFTAIRSAGLPASGQELNAWQILPADSENGALVMTQAFVLTRTFPDSHSNSVVAPALLARTNQWTADVHSLVAVFVLTNAPAIEMVRQAGHFEHFRYPVDYSYGLDTELPHLARLKNMARIIALQAALAAEEGRDDEWADSIRLLLNLASTLDEDPTIISHLVRNAMLQLAVKTAERGLNRVCSRDTACGRLQAAFARVDQTGCLERAFIGERALMIPMLRLSWPEINNLGQSEDGESQPRKPQRYLGKPAFGFWLTGFFERDLNFYLQTLDNCISLSKLPPPEMLALTNQFEAASQVARKKMYVFSSLLLPAFSRIAIREAAMLTHVRLAETAMAIERFRHAHGHLPDNLTQLVPEFLESVPADPFNGKPLRYRQMNLGYIIYGVGADDQDDNGREGPDRKKSTDTNSYDITFTVER